MLMKVSEHTLVFVQEMAGEDNDSTSTGVSWEVRTPAQAGSKNPGMQRIFIVPVCSVFSLDSASYHRFLEERGTLDQACALLAAGDLQTTDGAIITRKQVQSCIIAAEVESILGTYCIEA